MNQFDNSNIVAAFRGMHVSPAKHSYAWLPRKCDYRTDTRTDRQTDRRTPDKVIPMCCYALQAIQKYVTILETAFSHRLICANCVYNRLNSKQSEIHCEAIWEISHIFQPVVAAFDKSYVERNGALTVHMISQIYIIYGTSIALPIHSQSSIRYHGFRRSPFILAHTFITDVSCKWCSHQGYFQHMLIYDL